MKRLLKLIFSSLCILMIICSLVITIKYPVVSSKLLYCNKFNDLKIINTTLEVNSNLDFPLPTHYKYLNDYVGITDTYDTETIVSIGKELEDKTGAQATIVVINSTNNIPIEDYSNKLFRNWGIGEENKDNGLLILLAIDDKAWRVEVGRGLEGAIPDALSNKVMDTIGKPNFVAGNYSKGLLECYSAFSDYIASEYNVTLDKSLNIELPESNSSTSNIGISVIGGMILLGLFLDIILNKGRFLSTILKIIFWSNIGRHHGPRGGSSSGGFGGFGGGSSNGGGSSGGW